METIAFARGVPAPDMLPVDELREAASRAFDHDPVRVLSYGTGSGWEPLRALLAERQGVDVERVVVTTGSLQGFGLLAQVLASRAAAEGRRARVLVEQPTYDRPLLLLERLGVEVVPIPLDAHGVDVVALDTAMAAGADMAYLIPTFQNPAGATLTQTRRLAVLASAARHDVLVLEDDPYGLLHFDAPAPPTLFEQRNDAPIAFSGSFSKTIAPGLRVGWLVLPPDLAREVSTLANDTYISASFLGQATVHEFLASGEFEPNVERARGLLSDRCARLVEALERDLPGCSYTVPGGGYFIWVRLPEGLDATIVAQAAPAHGVSFVPGSSFGDVDERFARLAFSSPPIEQIETGVRRLAEACHATLATA